jgi:hypothetical protein
MDEVDRVVLDFSIESMDTAPLAPATVTFFML